MEKKTCHVLCLYYKWDGWCWHMNDDMKGAEPSHITVLFEKNETNEAVKSSEMGASLLER